MAKKAAEEKETVELVVAGRTVTVTNPRKVMFPGLGFTKLDLVQYFVAVADGALVGVRDRPMALKRYPNGAAADFFFQKRAPAGRPDWVRTATLHYPSGRSAEEVVVDDAAGLAWLANLGCLDLNPHAVRTGDLHHPDELRIDLDPGPSVSFAQVKEVAAHVKELLAELGYVGYPKTSGSRGIHVNLRIQPKWDFKTVRAAALGLARELEQRYPGLATSRWWKDERQGVFVDFNQNAKDKTVASAYSVRPVPDARVSAPFDWHELEGLDPAALTVKTVPARLKEKGDPGASIDRKAYSLEPLLELAAKHEPKKKEKPAKQ